MKYDEEAFNVSSQHYPNIQEVEIDSIDKRWQKKLLKILLKRFSEELEKNPNQNNGIVKVKFKSSFYQDSEEGYNLIKELVASQKFDSFASEYCFYLGNVEYRCDEYNSSYFEIIWDYKSYFESLSMSIIESEIGEENPNRNDIIATLKKFKELPIKYQLLILKSFLNEVNKKEKDFLHDEAVKKCYNEGHQFSKWKKGIEVTYEDAWFDHQLIPNYRTEKVVWNRKCCICGCVESVEEEPQELIDERKEKRKQAEIKRLERRLKKLKEND